MQESTGQFFGFPRRSCFTGAQAHRHILDPHCLARPQGKVPDDPVALVEQADHGDPFSHGRHPGLIGVGTRDIGRYGLVALIDLLAAVATRREEGQCDWEKDGVPRHAYSGFHAS